MHLLFITSLVTSGPPESGYEIANKALIDGFRRQGAVVTEIGYKWTRSTLTDPDHTICLGEVDLKTDGASTRQKMEWLGKAILSRTTFASAKLRLVDEAALDRAVAEAERRHGPVTGIILNGVTLAGAYEAYLNRRPFFFVAHNVEHISAGQNADDAASLIEKLLYRREARLLKALEARLCEKASHVLTLTEQDRHGLGVADDVKSTAVALVTPKPPHKPKDGRITAFDIGLIGSWTWTPNRIGLEWFLQEVVPLLPDDVQIAVAGATPRGMRARDKRVMLLGRVLDAKDFCRQNRVMALTSRIGTGVQLKTIEAFEMGLACVATTSSMRGISHTPDNVIVADTAKAFAEALVAQIAGHHAGDLPEADGATFRQKQMAKMDAALKKVLALSEATS